MFISIFGMGYVGAVSGACLASLGHNVIGIDVSKYKVDLINAGKPPIQETDINELFSKVCNVDKKFMATTSSKEALEKSDITMICVGTPSLENGNPNLSTIETVCQEIGEVLKDRKESFPLTIVMRSTVPPTTTRNLVVPIIESVSGKKHGDGFWVCHNPEFLREGSSIADFFNPPKTIVGQFDDDNYGAETVLSIYKELPGPKICTSLEVSEMVKYCDNSFHALKVTFANEVGMIAKSYGIDSREVMKIFCEDKKLNISNAYLKPGFAFGGSCLPKDLRALVTMARNNGIEPLMLQNILPSNKYQIDQVLKKIYKLNVKDIGLIGLSFKSGTDDLRESPIVEIAENLLGKGYNLRIYDDFVSLSRLVGTNRRFLEDHIPHISSILHDDLDEVITHSKVIIVASGIAVSEKLLNRPDVYVIDFVRNDPNLENHPNYIGLYW